LGATQSRTHTAPIELVMLRGKYLLTRDIGANHHIAETLNFCSDEGVELLGCGGRWDYSLRIE
jgi:hypothetical protein